MYVKIKLNKKKKKKQQHLIPFNLLVIVLCIDI